MPGYTFASSQSFLNVPPPSYALARPQSDQAKIALLRLLFTAAATPYLRRVRAWMYDPDYSGGASGAAMSAAPPAPPAFGCGLQRQLAAAGLQMRLLHSLGGELGAVAARLRRMAAVEVRACGAGWEEGW